MSDSTCNRYKHKSVSDLGGLQDLRGLRPTILAPMDGYSDWPFRSLCRDLGSAMSYTEFVRAADVLNRPHYVEKKLAYREEERPVVYQLYGHEAETILEAALRLRERGPDILDVNMGCPNNSIANRGAGVGLMRSPREVARIFKALTQYLDIPITGKIRLGWEDHKNYVQIAQIIEENGGALVAVHGRTKEQGYTGKADWDAIAEVCQAVSIPVVGNGDVKTVADIQAMRDQTGCEGVMIGRAARGNPWIFSGLDRGEVSPSRVEETMLIHLNRSLEFYGPKRGLILFRKFAARYLSPYDLSPEVRRKLLTRENPSEFKALLARIIGN
ncbi:MAG: putative tRNA-dihydrouridine synthase [Chloroflexi bacterium]|nr:putative tRNA-dihydrouridine synthase [Chloroflexota bacterium]